MKFCIKLFLILFTVLFCLVIVENSSAMQESSLKKIDCLECHTCEKPTSDDLCLKACPSLAIPSVHGNHTLKEAPDSFLIKEIADLYQPVKFNHKLHADMAQMGLECATCHHYSPPDRIPPCRECHSTGKDPANLKQPSLKGAYHRQCLSCHREWSHETQCLLCHLPSEKDDMLNYTIDSTDILGISHPIIIRPDKKIYSTNYPAGPVVTFYHQEHIDLFDLRCVDCHQEENCSYCHDLNIAEKEKKTEEEIHAICKDCHELCDDCPENNCKLCHDTKVKPAFSHTDKWRLSKYHEDLECRNCHPTGKQITRMNGDCTNCHAGWDFASFDHTVTGLKIDELHVEFDCADCHVDSQYHNAPDCSACHDDNRDFKKMPPGEFVK